MECLQKINTVKTRNLLRPFLLAILGSSRRAIFVLGSSRRAIFLDGRRRRTNFGSGSKNYILGRGRRRAKFIFGQQQQQDGQFHLWQQQDGQLHLG